MQIFNLFDIYVLKEFVKFKNCDIIIFESVYDWPVSIEKIFVNKQLKFSN